MVDLIEDIKAEDESLESINEQIIDHSTKSTYLKGKFLGKGAHARVYLVTDITGVEKKNYAIKVMNVESKSDQDCRLCSSQGRSRDIRLTQVLKEVQIHSMMSHKNIVKLEKWFKTDNKFYMVLEYCERNNLAQLLKTQGKLSEGESKIFMKQLLEGVQYMHDHGIIHRDLKPGNIYLTGDKTLKIGDLGLADRVNSGRKGICGTPNYISPEVLNEEGYTPAVDIWAVGCIAYHMLSGKPPFEADSQAATYELIKRHYYTTLLPTQASIVIRHLINLMLEYRPENRPTASFVLHHPWFIKRSHRKSHAKEQMVKTERISLKYSENDLHVDCTVQELSSRKENICNQSNSTPIWKLLVDKVYSFGLQKSEDQENNKNKLNKIKRKMSNVFKIKKCGTLKEMIENGLKKIPTKTLDNENLLSKPEAVIPSFVSKWIDYSDKYGFGYCLSDGSSGVLLNDAKQICYDHTKTCVTLADGQQRVAYPTHSVPEELKEKLRLLDCFVEYMDTKLSSGAEEQVSKRSTLPSPLIKTWYRNDTIIFMELSTGLTQVNFLQDHFKYVFYKHGVKYEHSDISMLVIDHDKNMYRYQLQYLAEHGFPEQLIQHLVYILSLL